MREIKFRAWDKQNNCWYKPIHEAYKGNLWELLVNFNGQLDAHSMEGRSSILIHESKFPDRYELMQFTGLKDKNGKEIYEGDIVEIFCTDIASTDCGQSKGLHEVAFNVGCFGYMWEMEPLKEKVLVPAYFNTGEDIYIKGNIYKNPELL